MKRTKTWTELTDNERFEIVRVLTALGMTQQKIADLLHCEKTAISDYQSCRHFVQRRARQAESVARRKATTNKFVATVKNTNVAVKA